MKMTTTYSAMIGHLFDIIIVATTNKVCSTGPSKFKSVKLLETVVSLLQIKYSRYNNRRVRTHESDPEVTVRRMRQQTSTF